MHTRTRAHTHTHTHYLDQQGQVTTGGHLTFSIEEELRFSTRYEEGYDLYDEKYEAWLKLHHPEASNKISKDGIPADPVTPLTRSASFMPSPSTSSHVSSDQPSTSATDTPKSSSTSATPKAPSKSATTTSKAPSTSATTTPKAPPSTSATTTPKASRNSQSTSGKRSPLAYLLNLPANARGSKQSKTPSTGHARVLTSSECLQMLKEKEEKKKQVQLEKEKRKVERELKEQQREEEQKLKAEAKAKRTAEREEAKAKREADKAKKEAARVEKAKQKSLSGTKRSSPSDPRSSRITKKIRSDMEAGEDTDHCCVCFGSYQEDIDTGREWVQCSCMTVYAKPS